MLTVFITHRQILPAYIYQLCAATKLPLSMSKKKKTMRTCLLIALTGCVALAACRKSSLQPKGIVGKWELSKETGGLAGVILYSHGKSNVWIFGADNDFQQVYVNGSTVTGTYSIKQSAAPGDFLLSSHYSSNGQPVTVTDSIRFSNNQLVVLPFAGCCDIPTSFYGRLE